MIRAKFQVTERTEYSHGSSKVVLEPRYDTSIPEDQRFNNATPSGRFEMIVNNPTAVEVLKPGRTFYLDLTPADQPQAAQS